MVARLNDLIEFRYQIMLRAVNEGPGENCSKAQWKLIWFSSLPLGGDQSMEVNNYKFSPGPLLTALLTSINWSPPSGKLENLTNFHYGFVYHIA